MNVLDAIQSGKRWHVEHADCRQVLAGLPDACVDAVITDWPYGVKIAEWDDAAPYDMLLEFLRISRGPVVTFGAAAKLRQDMLGLPVPPDRVLMWAPAFTSSHTQANGLFYRYHPIYCWRIPKKHDGPKHDVLRHNTNMGHMEWRHSCTKPESLMVDLCGFAPNGGSILDPFVGSGTTVVAALRRGQRGYGIEMAEEHVRTARDRCEAEVCGLSLRDARAGQRGLFE